jgi:hypothetical protein
MGTNIKQNTTTFNRCPKDEQHPFCRIPAKLLELDGYKLAIMAQILSNKDGWNIVKAEISSRVRFPREKFNTAWKALIELGYIEVKRIQGGYDYTIYEDPNSTSTTYGICEDSTSTTGRSCAGGTLTTINNNYYKDVTTTTGSTCDEGQFNELMELYPSEGTTKDGTTYKLKGKRDECKRAYIEYLKTNGMTHEEIMIALKVELNDKEMSGKTHFQPGLYRWLQDKVFEQYKGRILEPFKLGYGTELS